MRNNPLPRLLLLALALFSGPLRASDTAAENQRAAEVRQQLDGAEPVQLPLAQGSAFALFTPAADARGAVLLLPDINGDPDGAGVIGPLRRYLPRHKWATLAIQPPLPTPGAPADPKTLLEESQPRVTAAVAWLRGKGFERIALVGHGFGALTGLDWFAGGGDAAGLVAVGMGDTRGLPPDLAPHALLAKMTRPVFDLYGSLDPAAAGAPARLAAGRRENVNMQTGRFDRRGLPKRYMREHRTLITYRQVAIVGADHNFSNRQTALRKRVRGWLNRQVDGNIDITP